MAFVGITGMVSLCAVAIVAIVFGQAGKYRVGPTGASFEVAPDQKDKKGK